MKILVKIFIQRVLHNIQMICNPVKYPNFSVAPQDFQCLSMSPGFPF